MGLIIEDHGLGIHAELRRESFTVFSDFGKEWDVELAIDKLDEFFFVIQSLRLARNSGKHYAEHHRFVSPEHPDGKDCVVCRHCREGGRTDHEASHLHEALEMCTLEGVHIAFLRMRDWIKGETPARAKLIQRMCDDLLCSFEYEEVLKKKYTLNAVQQAARKIELETLLRAAAAVCAGCAKSKGPHVCSALEIRRLAARIDPDLITISPLEWFPKPAAPAL